MRQSKVWFTVALTLALVACIPRGQPAPPPPTPAGSCAEPSVITLDEGWLFRTDPDDVGVSQQWYSSPVEEANWQNLAPGQPWESSNLTYDGVAWYRTTITMPAWSQVYLGFGTVDDAATLWLDGRKEMSWQAGAGGPRTQALSITDLGNAGDQITVAFRIDDRGGYGGIKGPVSLSDEPRGVMGDSEAIRWLFQSHPAWPMPDWVSGGPLAWTMSGLPRAGREALVRSDGAVVPWATAPTTEVWLYDPAANQLMTGRQPATSFSLHEGQLPIPTWMWEAPGARVESTLFGDVKGEAVRWHVSVRNTRRTERDLILLLVVRPLGIKRSLAPICSVGLQGKTRVWLDGRPFLISGARPEEAGVGTLEAMMSAALRGETPEEKVSFSHHSGLAAASLAYRLSLRPGKPETLQFAFPAAAPKGGGQAEFPSVRGPADRKLARVTSAWKEEMDEVGIDLPDELVEEGMRASAAYLLLALDPDGPHPGPLAHDAMWVRDAAYIGLALLQLDQTEAVRGYIPDILASQESNGRVPPIQGENIPWDDEEWDAQGQTIFLITQYYRYTGDIEALKTWYPALRLAAEFIVDLRKETGATRGPAGGLLPPSKSAEDLGPGNRHYYWDNLWAVAGLQEAVYAARQLERSEDAEWMAAEAEALRSTILRSIEELMGPEPIYIPGAVEDVESSAMARGTVPALWPVRVLSPERALMKRSFRTYYERWIAPDQGGFRHHQDHFWPYGGLELAHAYLRLGQTDVLHEILGWTLNHQTLPGTYAWAEQVDPESGGISGGDMPHAWAAASYVTLVREMLVTEREGYVELFTGVPKWWFEDGSRIALDRVPTHFGELTLQTEGTVQQKDGEWTGSLRLSVSGATPPKGFRWKLPYGGAEVDGPSGVAVRDGWLIIPAGGGTVELVFAAGH